MARNKTKLSATTDTELRETLDRAARDQAIRGFALDLALFEYIYEQTHNPLAAWDAIALCHSYDLPLPAWVLGYLGDAASKVITAKPRRKTIIEKRSGKRHTAKQYAEPIASALGFMPPGKGNVFVRYENERHRIDAIYDELLTLTEYPEMKKRDKRGEASKVREMLARRYKVKVETIATWVRRRRLPPA